MALAIGIFAAALAAIASERIDRTRVAMLGALLMLLTQTLTQQQAIAAIDWGTLGLLAGMMVIVRLTERTGVYTFVAIRAAQLSKGRPLAVLAALAGTTALLSAFLDNLTTILLVVPITFVLADALDVDPIPLIVVEIVSSNIGGAATLIGDPPNILIAGHTGLSFTQFLTNLAPIAVPALVATTGLLYLGYRRRLQIAPAARARVLALDARRAIDDAAELRRLLPVLALTMLAFFLHELIDLEPATVALGGATIMLLLTRDSTEDALSSGIEWPTIFFFIGLFVMVGALQETGVLREVANGIGSLTDGDRSSEILGIAWASALGSAVVDNIPFTAAMLPVVDQLQGPGGIDQAYWWALSLGACFGGNATVIAAAANVAGAGLAARSGRPLTFLTFLRAGIPATLVSMALATGYIALRYL